ncbi:hypothetical protein MUK42_32843 [Musa troglodytarum]|uniref:BLISTER n=1 Tax=Musa troglodytarum TaxID=320322 RepID=A0A9E7HAA5_9LILI|nr:hypothetical protein MUK42_32843 [Musa troglodytarum]
MASAKVMSNSVASSRKQGHLELGKKKLEEFRKKKAAKQVASAGNLQSTDVDQYENSSKSNQQKEDDSSSRGGTNAVKTSGVVMSYEDKSVNSSQSSDVDSSTRMPVNSTAWNYNNHISHGNSEQEAVNDKVLRLPDSSTFSESANGYYDHWREKNELSGNEESKVGSADGFKADQHIAFDPDITKPYIDGNIHSPGFHLHNVESGDFENRVSSTSHMHDMDASGAYNMSTLPEKSESISATHTLGYLSTATKIHGVEKPFPISNKENHGTASAGGRIADAISRRLNVDNSTWHAPESFSAGFSSGFGRSSGETFPVTSYGTTFGRSRPSFLDSLGVPRVSSISNISYGDPDRIVTPVSLDDSKFQNTEAQLSASLQQPSADNSMEQSLRLTTLDSTREKQSSFSTTGFFDEEQQPKQRATDQDIQRDHEFPSLRKDEDFASLEQHIEDLTKEKFSLQRALQTAQTLAESLAAENSSLTDSFNQQGKVVNQLKSDMERLQEEIKAQMLAFESVKLEYTNAQLECNAADERAKLLASEVISLEEKALRLRSNELKLEKQLENLNSDITSFKRKVSVLEKERQDFQATVDALQEDVKDNENNAQGTMMNSGINGMQAVGPSAALSSVTASFLLDDRRMDLPDARIDLPQDQLRMIENIKALISELAVEKEELVQALRIESSNCSKLKDLNKDLSQKLEAQTQRLELLTSQRMANDNVLAKPNDMHSTHETMEYADEGDEVVERVLGWIMKLFPGGPAKRRTSKLL